MSFVRDDGPLLEQYQQQMADSKRELAAVYEELVLLDLKDDDLVILHARLEKLLFDCSHRIKKLLDSHPSGPTLTPVADHKGPKL